MDNIYVKYVNDKYHKIKVKKFVAIPIIENDERGIEVVKFYSVKRLDKICNFKAPTRELSSDMWENLMVIAHKNGDLHKFTNELYTMTFWIFYVMAGGGDATILQDIAAIEIEQKIYYLVPELYRKIRSEYVKIE